VKIIQCVVLKRFLSSLVGFVGLAAAAQSMAGSLTMTPSNYTDSHFPGSTYTYKVQLCATGEAAQTGSIVLTIAGTDTGSFNTIFAWDANINGNLEGGEVIASGGTLPAPIAADACVQLLVRVTVSAGASIGATTTNTLTATHASLAPTGVAAQITTVAGDAKPPITVTVQPNASTSRVTSFPAGIDCPGTCTHAFDEGVSVYLSAEAAPDRSFTGWTGCTDIANGVCRGYVRRRAART
jgi:hypothetical protein